MRLISLIIFIVSYNHYLLSQISPGARQISLSNSDVALSNDVFSLVNNPAGLSQMNWREAGIYYSPAPFGMSELSNGFIAYNEPLSFGSAAIGGMSYGFDLYRENKLLFAFSYKYLNKFFIGAALNYHTIAIKNYGSDAALYFNIGGLVYLNSFLKWGFSFQNINRASFSDEDDQIPVVLNSGISYDVLENVSLNLALQKDISRTASLLAGIEYYINDFFALRTGISNEPSRYSAGLGINYSIFAIDYAMFTHQNLGLTHQAGIIISFDSEGSRMKNIHRYLNIE